MFQTKVAEKIKTRLCRIIFFFTKVVSLFEIMWKNIVEPGRPQMTIWPVRVRCWLPKATNIHSQYVALIAFPL